MLKLSEIARILELPAPTTERTIRGVATLDEAGDDQIGFVTSMKFAPLLAATRAAAVLVPDLFKVTAPAGVFLLKVPDVELALVKLLPKFSPAPSRPCRGIHPSAVVDPTSTIDPTCCIGPNVTIGSNVKIAARSVLHPGVVVDCGAAIGSDCEIHPNVVVRDRTQIGNRVNIKAGSVVGSDGFGFRWDGKQHVKIPQVGIVVIEDDVEIGSNTTIDRAKFGETRIGRGTKIDNQVQIGHNVKIGMHVIICAQSGVAGSAVIGNGVVMGANTGIANQVRIGDRVTAAARTGVASEIEPNQTIAGSPSVSHRDWLREQAALRKLPELVARVRELEEKLARLQSGK